MRHLLSAVLLACTVLVTPAARAADVTRTATGIPLDAPVEGNRVRPRAQGRSSTPPGAGSTPNATTSSPSRSRARRRLDRRHRRALRRRDAARHGRVPAVREERDGARRPRRGNQRARAARRRLPMQKYPPCKPPSAATCSTATPHRPRSDRAARTRTRWIFWGRSAPRASSR